MINTFVSRVRECVGAGLAPPGILCFLEDEEDCLYWYFDSLRYSAEHVCIIYEDGSAQLLSRDEDECLLFAALWELER